MTNKSIQKMVPLMVVPVLVATTLWAEPFEAYKPTWEMGQKWIVEVRGKTPQPKLGMRNPPPFVAQWATTTRGFLVEKVVEVEGDPCWCIRVDYLRNGTRYLHATTYYRMYYRVSDSSLKRKERICLKTGKVEVGRTFSGDSSIIIGRIGSLPMGFPFFHADSEKYSPKPHIRSDGIKIYNSYEAYQTCRIIEEKVGDEKKKVLSIHIKEKDEVKEQEGLAVLQLWEKGMPWWSEATETENGTFYRKARLISIDGKKLENPCPWNLDPANSL